MKKNKFLFLFGVLFVFSKVGLTAQSEIQTWLQVNQTFFLNDSISVFTELHPRITLSEGELSSFIARSALQYQIGSFQVGAGLLWQTTHFPNDKEEVRQFLQSSFSHQTSTYSDFSHRLRLEQRQFKGSGLSNHRFRYQLRSIHSWLDSEIFRILLANEMFFNLNSSENSEIVSGLDQNRLFAGVTIRWSENATSDLAYLLNYVRRAPSDDSFLNHILFYCLNVNF